MNALARGASSEGRKSFFGRTTAASALVIALATACGGTPESGEPTPSDSTTKGGQVNQGGSNDSAGGNQNTGDNQTPGTGGTTTTPAEVPEPPAYTFTPNATCNAFVEGENTITVDGKARKFIVQLPKDTSDMAVLFVWHGFLQDSNEFSNTVVYDPQAAEWKPFDPNAFNKPLMVITPTDANRIPIWGLDWDIVSGVKDFPYFEGMLKCADTQFNIDRRRIYSFGFSAGAVFTNLLSSAYPKTFAATIAESGVWFNDKPEQQEIKIPGTGTVFMKWKWPELDPADRGAVMITHGGPNDFATVISLENSAQKAFPFLYERGRDVTDCSHEFGHTLEPDITQAMYYEFMWNHQVGGKLPTALSSSLPTPEKPLFNTKCTFRPAK